MKKAFLLSIMMCYFVVAGVVHAKEYKSMTVRIACSTPSGSVQAVPLERLAEIIHKESNGKIKCEIFSGGVLGDEQAVVKQLRSNEIQMGVLAAGNLTPFAPRATLFILPYMFPSKEHAFKLFRNEALMNEFADAIAAQSKTRPLGWLVGGYRVLTNSKRPINTMEDMAGLKWRVPPVELQLAAFRSWGVEPHPLAWIETFNGLQQGVIDGQENPHLINRDTKFWEVQKYITEIHYMLWVAPIMVSERWFSNLDPDTRDLFVRAAKQAAEYEWEWAEKEDIKALQQCLDGGMVYNTVTDEDKWMERARKLWPQFYNAVGGKEVIDRALAAMN